MTASIEIMNEAMLQKMRASCKLAAQCLCEVGKRLEVGMCTDDINSFVHKYIIDRGGYPAPLNYKGFPKSVCTSLNDVVCHGIPGPQVLKNGDIINIDVTSYFPRKQGYHGDTSATFYIGEVSEEAKKVTEVSRRSLEVGIAEVKNGARIGDIGAAIQEYAESQGCSVVRDYVGHGVGRSFHMPPQIPHFGTRGRGKRMRTGMVFTIEPMINLGAYDTILEKDEWTVRTADGSLSAQFEHSLVVTEYGSEVLTQREEKLTFSEDVPWVEACPLSAPATCS